MFAKLYAKMFAKKKKEKQGWMEWIDDECSADDLLYDYVRVWVVCGAFAYIVDNVYNGFPWLMKTGTERKGQYSDHIMTHAVYRGSKLAVFTVVELIESTFRSTYQNYSGRWFRPRVKELQELREIRQKKLGLGGARTRRSAKRNRTRKHKNKSRKYF